MSKCRHKKCCCPPAYNYGAMGAYGRGYGGGMYAGGDFGTWYMKWFYALLLLIVIVLQFGRKDRCKVQSTDICGDDGIVVENYGVSQGKCCNGQLIDSSVLFIIVIFLLALCGGCWWGGFGGGSGY